MPVVSIIVSGRVQGVWFRRCTCDMAEELSVSGTVRNLPNGDVQIQATGSKEQLGRLEEWCWKGSPLSKVENVTVTQIESRSFDGFRSIW